MYAHLQCIIPFVLWCGLQFQIACAGRLTSPSIPLRSACVSDIPYRSQHLSCLNPSHFHCNPTPPTIMSDITALPHIDNSALVPFCMSSYSWDFPSATHLHVYRTLTCTVGATSPKVGVYTKLTAYATTYSPDLIPLLPCREDSCPFHSAHYSKTDVP